ncbi:hypothetical protein ACFQEX_02445 [Roseibium salinum]|uniref:hypothetical protein n=1 Tax=Roseibium salinum TaxID=1604349 RepID=UPI003622DAEB
MRHVAAQARFTPVFKSGLLAACGLVFLACGTAAHAQSAPETLRINVEPSQPGIRSITVNKGYRPIISRDDKGVVIDTMGSDSKLPPCDIKLEVTLENSRVLHRDANICSGNTLVVDVSNDGKPGVAARVVGTDTGVAAGPVSKSPADSPSSQTSGTSTPQSDAPSEDEDSSIARIDPPAESGGLEPLEQRDTPISAPEGSETPGVSGDLETIVRERIGGSGNGNGNGQPVLVTPGKTGNG